MNEGKLLAAIYNMDIDQGKLIDIINEYCGMFYDKNKEKKGYGKCILYKECCFISRKGNKIIEENLKKARKLLRCYYRDIKLTEIIND